MLAMEGSCRSMKKYKKIDDDDICLNGRAEVLELQNSRKAVVASCRSEVVMKS